MRDRFNACMNNLKLIHLDKARKTFLAFLITTIAAGLIYLLGGQYALFGLGVFAPHDAFYPVTPAIFGGALNLFYSGANFVKNFASFFQQLPDRVFLDFLVSAGISTSSSQIVHTLVCYLLFISCSFYVFSKITNSSTLLILSTLAYCFSPFMAIFYNTGVFYVFSTVIALSVIPAFLSALLDIKQRENIWIISGTIFVFAFNLLFLLPALILLIASVAIQYRVISLSYIKKFPKEIFLVVIFSVIPIGIFVYLNNAYSSTQGVASGAALSLQGGIFYPLMQISSWIIYSDWQPRAIVSFAPFFFTPGYKFLSVLLVLVLITCLFDSKKYRIIFLLVFAAFGAKGPQFPFGEIFSWVVNNVPFGYMMRSPDNKFGAFIPAIILVGVLALPKFSRNVVSVILALFLCYNLHGLFLNGALSAEKSGLPISSYIYDEEYLEVSKILDQYENSIVLSPFESCSGVYTQNKFHTCKDLVLSNVNRQVVPREFGSLELLTKTYELFPTIVYFNKNKPQFSQEFTSFNSLRVRPDYKQLYSSTNYLLFVRNSGLASCGEKSPFSCVRKDGLYIYSTPELYYQYLTGAIKGEGNYTSKDGLIQATEPLKGQPSRLSLLFEWAYMLSWVLNIFLLFTHLSRRSNESLPAESAS